MSAGTPYVWDGTIWNPYLYWRVADRGDPYDWMPFYPDANGYWGAWSFDEDVEGWTPSDAADAGLITWDPSGQLSIHKPAGATTRYFYSPFFAGLKLGEEYGIAVKVTLAAWNGIGSGLSAPGIGLTNWINGIAEPPSEIALTFTAVGETQTIFPELDRDWLAHTNGDALPPQYQLSTSPTHTDADATFLIDYVRTIVRSTDGLIPGPHKCVPHTWDGAQWVPQLDNAELPP